MYLLRRVLQLLTYLGPNWVAFRFRYALRKKIGALVWRAPFGKWSDSGEAKFTGREPILFRLNVSAGEGCVAEAEAILTGRFRLFSRHQREVGFPPPWHINPITGQKAPGELHWSRIGDFGSGDIKGVWELSRFPWAWQLGRAYVRTGDERFAEGFWALFENWLACNPPNRGANWMCGQEATFRLMAATFARHVLEKARATTSLRVSRFQEFVQATGRRIAVNLDYALSQSNNHGVSECIGLLTASIVLPSAAESNAWRIAGLRALKSQLGALVYSDGAFSQHSAIYHRVLLYDLLWGITLLRSVGQEVPAWWLEAAQRALGFIDALVTPGTGRVPLYGANDGANILPLADADYLDFRPLVQAGFAVLHGMRRFSPGPWDEAGHWLVGAESLGADSLAPRPTRSHAPAGGCLVWRRSETRLFLRCPERFLHRPSQADLQHVDLEWRGHPIAIDPGTFSYNTTGPLAGGMKEAALHNTVTFDGAEPLQKAGRFLYLPWPRGFAAIDDGPEGQAFQATHSGWEVIGASHVRRCSVIGAEGFVVTDLLRKSGEGRARLHWLLADVPCDFSPIEGRLVMHVAAGPFALRWTISGATAVQASLVRADPNSARGWSAPYYFEACPAWSLAIDFSFSNEARCVTDFSPA